MSDRRPSKLYTLGDNVIVGVSRDGQLIRRRSHDEASPADLVAVVRRGVESGTIKGEVRTSYWSVASYQIAPVKAGTYLVIPVSDGGSET